MSRYLREHPDRRKFWSKILGKLQLHYTTSKIHSELNGHKESIEYRVIAKDDDSTAIVLWNPLLNKKVISHIHFDDKHYWVAIGPFREFFKRINPKRKRANLGA